MVLSEFGVINMQGCVVMCGINTTGYLSIVVEHVHPVMTTMVPSSSHGYFQLIFLNNSCKSKGLRLFFFYHI